MTGLSQAWRALARRRAFTLVTILTLAATVGITATVFSIANAIVWKPLPFPDAAQLVSVYEEGPGARQRIGLLAPVRLDEWRRQSRTFTSISGSYSESFTDTSVPDPERLDGRRVAPGFFDVFGMRPLGGRTFVGG